MAMETKTNWLLDDTVMPDDMNRIEGNIKKLNNTMESKFTFDKEPTENSTNPVESQGIKSYVDENDFKSKNVSGTEIEITDAAEMESVLQLSGNSEQDSRSGKNKLKKYSNSGSLTANDITITQNSDGTFTLNGTATTNTWFEFVYDFKVNTSAQGSYAFELDSTKQYTYSVSIISGTSTGDWSASVDIGKTASNAKSARPNKPITFSGVNGIARGWLMIPTDAVCNNLVVGVQLEEGSTATSYEPYGVQPSPDYPSEIRSVKSKSDNLLDMDSWTVFDKQSNGSYKSNIELRTNTAKFTLDLPIDVYTLSYSIKADASKDSRYRITAVYEDGTQTIASQYSTGEYISTSLTTEAKKISYITFAYNLGAENTYLKDVMLNKGSTAYPYQPYGYVPVEVKVEGKNKFDANAKNLTEYKSTVEVNGNAIKVTQVNATSGSDYATIVIPHSEKLLGKTVTLSCSSITPSASNDGRAALFHYSKSTNTYGRVYVSLLTGGSSTATLPNEFSTADGQFVILLYSNQGGTGGGTATAGDYVTFKDVQLEINSVATPYEPYKLTTISLPLGDIELRSTPDGTRDTFTRVDGVWNKVDYVKAFRYDGSDDEAWGNQSGGADTENTAMFAMSTSLNANYVNRISYCNRFKYYTNGSVQNSTDDVEGFNFNPSARYSNFIYFRIKKSLLPTGVTSPWKTWLTSNPIEVVFPVKTPTYIPITDQALISALDELEELILHKGYNYITATAVNGVKTQLDLTYFTNTKGTEDVKTYVDIKTKEVKKYVDSKNTELKTYTNTELGKKQNKLTFDSTPTSGSSNPVTSGGVYTALNTKANTSAVLTKTNTTSFTPSANYHPATKKYVDDTVSNAISSAITTALEANY